MNETAVLTLVVQSGSFGLLAFIVFWSLTRVLPERDREFLAELKTEREDFLVAIGQQRADYLGASKEQREQFERFLREDREESKRQVEHLAASIRTLADLVVRDPARWEKRP